MPRLDRIHTWRRKNAGSEVKRPQVLFFGFSRKDKVPGRNIKKLRQRTSNDGGQSRKNRRSMVGARLGSALYRRLQRHCRLCSKPTRRSGYRKDQRPDETSGGNSTIAQGGGKLPSNIKVVRGGDPFELVTQSSVVVGFNTTGLMRPSPQASPSSFHGSAKYITKRCATLFSISPMLWTTRVLPRNWRKRSRPYWSPEQPCHPDCLRVPPGCSDASSAMTMAPQARVLQALHSEIAAQPLALR